MKKMKGIAAAMGSSSTYAAVYEDPKTRFKHQSLMQDFEEVYEETEAKKKKLKMLQQKKLTLLAEVRFLRRRYKYLTLNQSQNLQIEQNHVRPNSLGNDSTNVRKERIHVGKEAALLPPVPLFDLNKKGKIHNEREATMRNPAMMKGKKTYIGKEAALRNAARIPDLNQKERIYSGKEATIRNVTPVFDLNQISMEEEESQANGDTMRIGGPNLSSARGGSDEQLNDMNLSACRNVGGSSRAGKRKISWQDQVALRV